MNFNLKINALNIKTLGSINIQTAYHHIEKPLDAEDVFRRITHGAYLKNCSSVVILSSGINFETSLDELKTCVSMACQTMKDRAYKHLISGVLEKDNYKRLAIIVGSQTILEDLGIHTDAP